MRIIAGEFRSRILKAPKGDATRPTTDRARESLFNVLNNLINFTGIRVLDLYAGSGAFSFEALSRGAKHATLVERDRNALQAIKENAEQLGVVKKVTIVNGDALTYLRNQVSDEIGLIVSDPPYDDPVAFQELPFLLQSWKAKGAVCVIEHRSSDSISLPEGAKLLRELKAGEAAFTIF